MVMNASSFSVYGLNYSTVFQLNKNAASSYIDLTTLPGLLTTGTTFSSLVNLSFDAVTSVPFSVDCGALTEFGCNYGLNGCQVDDTTTGIHFCGNPSILSAIKDTPQEYNIMVSSLLQNSVLDFVDVLNNISTYSRPMSYSEPVFFTNLYGESYVNILATNNSSTTKTDPNSTTTIIVSAGMAPIVQPVLYADDNIVEYAAATVWFDDDRQIVFINITPQTLGGYFPLYGFLPSLYTAGGSGFLPATYFASKFSAIAPGQGFYISNMQFNPSDGTYTTISTSVFSVFVLLTDPTTGLLTLNFVDTTTTPNTITRLSFNGGTSLKIADSTKDGNEFFGVLGTEYDGSGTTSCLLSAVVSTSGITYYSTALDGTGKSINRNVISGVGTSTWNWAASSTSTATPGLLNQTIASMANDTTKIVMALATPTLTFTDTYTRTITSPNTGGPSVGPPGAGGPSAAAPPSITPGTKVKKVTTPIPKGVKLLAIAGVSILVITVAVVLILANT
jgi:hypothetical protein